MNKQTLPAFNSSFLLKHDLGNGDLCIAHGFGALDLKFDFDVWLPSRNMNLQRPLVWTVEQKRNLIESVLVRRAIPPISVIFTTEDVYQVIDGKQRTSAFISYLRNEFDFCGYFCDELPKDYLGQIKRHWIATYRLCEYSDRLVTDDEKIEWFRWINFSGTPQDSLHLQELEKN